MTNKRFEAANKLANEFIAVIKQTGKLPWTMPWFNSKQVSFSGNAYKGINQMWLSYLAHVKGYNHNVWVTFNQIKKNGGWLKKGEKAATVLWWKVVNKAEEGEEPNFICVGSGYAKVFNLSQLDKLGKLESKVKELKDNQTITSCEAVLKDYPVKVISGGNKAAYSPSKDEIYMPDMATFLSSEMYYHVLFHETIHSTGHTSRLDRIESTSFGSHEYSKEELVAEMGASLLSLETGIFKEELFDNSAAYLQSWLSALDNNPQWIVQAAQQATKAVEFILEV